MARAWIGGAGALCVLLIVSTMLYRLQVTSGALAYLFAKLDLAVENNPAAWWSGFLLMMNGLHAYDGYAGWKRRNQDVAKAWLIIALVMLALSADELGSLHERVSLWSYALGLGRWLGLLPFALVLGGLLAWAIALLWACDEERPKVRLLCLGVLLLGSIAIHEFVEHRLELHSVWARALRASLEEGTELLGMMVLLAVTVRNTGGLFGRTSAAVFEAIPQLRMPSVVLALPLAPILAWYTSALPDHVIRGRPADVLAAFLFAGAGLAPLRRYFVSGENVGWRAWLLSGACFLASVLVIDVDPSHTIEIGGVSVHPRMLLLTIIALLLATVWAMAIRSVRWEFLTAMAAVAGVLLVLLSFPGDPIPVYLSSQVLALAAYLLHSAPGPEARSGPDGSATGAPRRR